MPWVTLIWESYYKWKSACSTKKAHFGGGTQPKLLDKSKGFVFETLHNGKTSLLWEDIWNGMVPLQSFPALLISRKG